MSDVQRPVRPEAVFAEVHDEIPRGGPGDFESTRKAFRMLAALPEQPRILDVGCGPGVQTLDLARLTDGAITAVDNHEHFLGRLRGTLAQSGLADRVTVLEQDMFRLRFEPQSFDAIWAEGSIYIIGFEAGLRSWRPLLRRPGYLAATEITWLRPDPPEELVAFWAKEYPAMQDVEANLTTIRRAGYVPLGHFTLPESAWWEPYYGPIERKLPALRAKYREHPRALTVLQLEQTEIDLYRRYSAYYGYVFYAMQVRDGMPTAPA